MARMVFEINDFSFDDSYPLGFFDATEVSMGTPTKVAFTEGARTRIYFDKIAGKYMLEIEELDLLVYTPEP